MLETGINDWPDVGVAVASERWTVFRWTSALVLIVRASRSECIGARLEEGEWNRI